MEAWTVNKPLFREQFKNDFCSTEAQSKKVRQSKSSSKGYQKSCGENYQDTNFNKLRVTRCGNQSYYIRAEADILVTRCDSDGDGV